jgi:hypothetical protein
MSDQPPDDETLFFNGLNGATGNYLLPAMTPAQISRLAQGGSLEVDVLDELKLKADEVKNPGNYEVQVEDHRDLSQTGWGIIFPYDSDPAVREALQPLVDHRREQAGEKFRLFAGEDGYRPGESKSDFLARFGMGPGPVNPEKVPYYLLIVGEPGTIPFRFQYQLDVQYAVGRLHFALPEEYARYAQSVIQSETGLRLPRRATLFGVSNPDDRATAMSTENLVQPLAEKLVAKQAEWAAKTSTGSKAQWQVQSILREQATKARLTSLLSEGQAPALLFSASHGLAFPNGDPRQLPQQGALVCQDWPGPEDWRDPIPEDFFYSSSDLSDDDNLLGTLAFFFACYGAGTPQTDEFASQIWSDQPERRNIAPHDFIAGLPRRMLSLPRGGALAVVGHVERAWGVSFYWGKAGPQIQVFQDCFERLMRHGYPLGYAMEVFNERYAELSSDLSDELGELRFKKPDDRKLAQMWTANNDARNYVLLGDPAVRSPTGDISDSQEQRPSIPEVAISKMPAAAQPASPGAPQVVAPIMPGAAVDYGLLDNLGQARANIGSALQQFMGKLGDFLGKALDEATSLEVSTYVSEDMENVRYESGRFTGGARLRAITRIEIDGDTLICVPETEGEVDTAVWGIHMDMVQQAQASRAELLKTVVSAATGMVELLKPGG